MVKILEYFFLIFIFNVVFKVGRIMVFLFVDVFLIIWIVMVIFLFVVRMEFGVKGCGLFEKKMMLNLLLIFKLYSKLIINVLEVLIGCLFMELEMFIIKMYFCLGFLKGRFGLVGCIIERKKFFFVFLYSNMLVLILLLFSV